MAGTVAVYGDLCNANYIEDILCLSVLIANGVLEPDSLVEQAEYYNENIVDCQNCDYHDKCLAYIING